MDQPTKSPTDTPIEWLASGVSPAEFAERVRNSFSLCDPIEGRCRTELHLTFRGTEAVRVLACADHLLGTRVTVDGTEVGTVRERAFAAGAGEVYVWLEFDPDVTPEQLAGKAIRLPLFETVERDAVIVSFAPVT